MSLFLSERKDSLQVQCHKRGGKLPIVYIHNPRVRAGGRTMVFGLPVNLFMNCQHCKQSLNRQGTGSYPPRGQLNRKRW